MHWPYTKRPDGRIAITLDNNVWDFLFDRGIDLASELPSEDFAVFITREVEIEGSAIPDDPSKTALKGYIVQTISSCDIQTTSVFGFASPGPGPQRVGGVGKGHGSLGPKANFTQRSENDSSLGNAKRKVSLRKTKQMPRSRHNRIFR
jgi:hypothetical protein